MNCILIHLKQKFHYLPVFVKEFNANLRIQNKNQQKILYLCRLIVFAPETLVGKFEYLNYLWNIFMVAQTRKLPQRIIYFSLSGFLVIHVTLTQRRQGLGVYFDAEGNTCRWCRVVESRVIQSFPRILGKDAEESLGRAESRSDSGCAKTRIGPIW